MFTLLSISKSIAFFAIVGVLVYFILTKNYKQAVYAILAFIVIRLVYQFAVGIMFGANESWHKKHGIKNLKSSPPKGRTVS